MSDLSGGIEYLGKSVDDYLDSQSFGEKLRKAAEGMAKTGALLSAARYSHRNGETEPPTQTGWYWFTGDTYDTIGRFGLWFVLVTSRVLVIGEEGEITDWEGQWWGPIMPPWESNA